METRLRHLYESLHGFKTETQKHICEDLCTALRSKTKTNLADLFNEAIIENTKLEEIDEPFITDTMLKTRHQTEVERCESEQEAKGTVLVTDAMKSVGSVTIQSVDTSYDFKFLQREVPHLKGMKSEKRGNKAWIDYIGITDKRPVLGEIKCGSDQNPFYAFIQLLTYLSELATPSQLKRAVTHNLFGEECQFSTGFDLHILLTDINEKSAKWKLREPAKQLAESFKQCVRRDYSEHANLVGRILCLSTMVKGLAEDKMIVCHWDV